MKASELIEKLQAQMAQFGDCEVIAFTEWETYRDKETDALERSRAKNSVSVVNVKERRDNIRTFVLE